MRLISSQVSSINPELTGRWDNTRRYQVTWQMLAQVQPARFITHRFPIAQAAQAFELLDRHPEDAVQVILTY
jgi:threonine dehydrogenase-like Zn-dependent dehydrogenase